jgi:hypothetical protein
MRPVVVSLGRFTENMPERIHELLHRNLQEVFGEADLPAAVPRFQKPNADDCMLYMPPRILLGTMRWPRSPLMAELVRIFHGIKTHEAQEAVDALIERKTPLIWEIGGIKRALDTKMPTEDQVLLFLHQHQSWIAEKGLSTWVEYKNPTDFRNKVLKALHKARLLEYDQKDARARISPLGAAQVEARIIKTRTS